MTVAEITAGCTEIALRATIKLGEYDFEAPVKLVCEKVGIPLPTEGPQVEHGGLPYRVYGFDWPDDAAAFLAHFKKTDYAPWIVTSRTAAPMPFGAQ